MESQPDLDPQTAVVLADLNGPDAVSVSDLSPPDARAAIERFVEKGGGAGAQRTGLGNRILVSGHYNYRQMVRSLSECFEQFNSVHSWHLDIE